MNTRQLNAADVTNLPYRQRLAAQRRLGRRSRIAGALLLFAYIGYWAFESRTKPSPNSSPAAEMAGRLFQPLPASGPAAMTIIEGIGR